MNLPKSLYSGIWTDGAHCQGIALDRKNGWMYYSFTTLLVKTDLQGRVLGSVGGLTGHLGCISFCEEDGCVYGSLEYKDDVIGRGIRKMLGSDAHCQDAFYITLFEGAKIDRLGMDATTDSVMRAVYLPDVVADYTAQVCLPDGSVVPHRYGCSGIDGTAIGPLFGAVEGENVLTVAYGIYSDLQRSDNDDQVLLSYSLADLRKAAQPLSQEAMHHSAAQPIARTFAHTGNTTYGIQNLEYDPYTQSYLAAVYPGKKPQYDNDPLFAFDATAKPVDAHVPVRGFPYVYGATGLIALGEGYYYVSYDQAEGGGWSTTVRLCRWDGTTPLSVVE